LSLLSQNFAELAYGTISEKTKQLEKSISMLKKTTMEDVGILCPDHLNFPNFKFDHTYSTLTSPFKLEGEFRK